jgi:molybdopterin synthase sulfur carrier subunit
LSSALHQRMDETIRERQACPVPVVEWTSHLETHFPGLGRGPLPLAGSTVAEVVADLERRAPGIEFYVCDELGRLRKHVNIFVDGEMIADRRRLSDRVKENSRVLIMQALSGG